MSRTISWLLVIVMMTLSVRADVPLVQKVEDAIRAAEPGWQCIHAVWNAGPTNVPSEKLLLDRLLINSIWVHTSSSGRRESVRLKLFQVDSRSDAEMSLSTMREAKVAPGVKVKPYGIGDEAYLRTFGNGGRYEIQFRKGTVIVRVSSDSISLAERFAKYVEREIPAN